MPFDGYRPVVHLSLPIVQLREIGPGETVGYNRTWTARRPSLIATVSGGYADGLLRSLQPHLRLWAGDTPCPAVGRISMDLITVDVTDLRRVPEVLDIIGPHQDVNDLAAMAGTIGYEVLTSLGPRYLRRYTGAA
jgi:alanine racemase